MIFVGKNAMKLDKQGIPLMNVNRYVFPFGMRCDYSRQPRPFYILSHVLSGEGVFEEEGRSCRVAQGDTAFIPLHSCYCSHWMGEPETAVLSCFFLLPDCAMLTQRRFLLQKVETLPDAGETLRSLWTQQNDETLLFSVLSRFYGLCDRLFSQVESVPAPRLSPRIQTAVEYIRAHYRERISVEALSARCNMSVSHFYSCFHQEVGVSPIAYKHRVAVTAAEQLLASDDALSIEEVSDWVGFESSAYFRRVFRSLVGCSPRDYRRQERV